MAAPYGNRNAEKWTFRKSVKLFNDAIAISNEKEKILVRDKKGEVVDSYETFKFDFIGEVARELGTFHEIFAHLSKRFPSLKRLEKQLISNLEQNCYSNTKKGHIREATGIVNLKSNHGWTDRVDQTTKGNEIKTISTTLTDDQINAALDRY